ALSLKLARQQRNNALTCLASGIDPAEQARIEKAKAENATTFEAVARQWHKAQFKRGKWSPGHAERVLREMETNLFPALGQLAVESIRSRDLMVPLRAVEERDALDMAARLKQRICGIMRHAVQTGLIDYNPAQDLTGVLTVRKTKHRPALPLDRLGELQQRIS